MMTSDYPILNEAPLVQHVLLSLAPGKSKKKKSHQTVHSELDSKMIGSDFLFVPNVAPNGANRVQESMSGVGGG